MNIFALSEEPGLAAQAHTDKHVVKMITESAQIMSTVLIGLGVEDERLYKETHQHHPCVRWAATNKENFFWLHSLLFELIKEYDYRWPANAGLKFLRAREIADASLSYLHLLPLGQRTPFALHGTVAGYRRHYVANKLKSACWTRREPPKWIATERKMAIILDKWIAMSDGEDF
jgi:hypothetical protein